MKNPSLLRQISIFLPLLALLPGLAGCQSPPTPDPDPVDAMLAPPDPAVEIRDVSGEELAEIAGLVLDQAWPAYYLEGATEVSMKTTGVNAPLPPQVRGFRVIPYVGIPSDTSAIEDWEGWSKRSLDIRFLRREGNELEVRAFTRNPIGGPSISDLLLRRGPDGWEFVRLLASAEYL